MRWPVPRSRDGEWHAWFAWYSVIVDGEHVWLERVVRRRVGYALGKYWEYRHIGRDYA